MLVKDWMTRSVVTISKETSMAKASILMTEAAVFYLEDTYVGK
jgi:CBS domain-containing protein